MHHGRVADVDLLRRKCRVGAVARHHDRPGDGDVDHMSRRLDERPFEVTPALFPVKRAKAQEQAAAAAAVPHAAAAAIGTDSAGTPSPGCPINRTIAHFVVVGRRRCWRCLEPSEGVAVAVAVAAC